MEIDQLLQGPFDAFRLGYFLGLDDTPEQKRQACSQGRKLLEHYGVVPRKAADPGRSCPVPGCGAPFTEIRVDRQRYGWRFRCENGHRRTPTVNTFLSNVKLDVLGEAKIVKIIFCWLFQKKQNFTIENVHVSKDTAVAWFDYCRDVATKIAWHEFQQIGGPQDIVEIGETHLFKRKCHRGRLTTWEDVWLVGAISRTTKKRFGVLVERRDEDTLLPILQRYIDSDSLICSYQSKAYGRVADVFAGHETVNHSGQFVRPPVNEDPLWAPPGRFHPECLDKNFVGPPPDPAFPLPWRVHNTAERQWRDLKDQLKSCNRRSFCKGYVGEWMYRRNILDGIEDPRGKFERFLTDIGRAYPGVGRRIMECQCHECDEDDF